MNAAVTPFSLKDAPALIERLLPVQKLSAESYKEQMAGSGKTLTALGSYWKGRKPLILNKACKGWRAKVFLYCVEAKCPQTGWMVPLLPSLIVSKGYHVVAQLVPDSKAKRYDIVIRSNASDEEFAAAAVGTVRSDGPGKDSSLIHVVNGAEFRTKISTLRGDYRRDDGTNGNSLRFWGEHDFRPLCGDTFQERLYCVQWMRPKKNRKGDDYEFREVTTEDLKRERIVDDFIARHLIDWQKQGCLPNMRIEPGYNTDQPIRERGWTYWHHLWNPRHLLSLALMKKCIKDASLFVLYSGILDFSSRLSRWETTGARMAKDGSGKQLGGASNNTKNVFYNQALNTLYNYGCRSVADLFAVINKPIAHFPVLSTTNVKCISASEIDTINDIYITDPPYGDAVKYEEILEFFIAWLRKNPPSEFADWVWDSRRAMAIKGEDEDFRRGMVAAYKRMTECMPDNGIQVVMFTHQSGKGADL